MLAKLQALEREALHTQEQYAGTVEENSLLSFKNRLLCEMVCEIS